MIGTGFENLYLHSITGRSRKLERVRCSFPAGGTSKILTFLGEALNLVLFFIVVEIFFV